jgi:amino-acid N-acetyltransferase
MTPELIENLSEARALLSACGLPTADLSDACSVTLFGARVGQELVATAGVEVFGSTALLRSVATLPTHRGKGLADQLVKNAEQYARQRGAKSVALLTTSSSSFFARHGYARIAREEAPMAIKRTQQFESLCPRSAVLMLKMF